MSLLELKLDQPTQLEVLLGNSLLCIKPEDLFCDLISSFNGYLKDKVLSGEFSLIKHTKSTVIQVIENVCEFGIFGSQDDIFSFLDLNFINEQFFEGFRKYTELKLNYSLLNLNLNYNHTPQTKAFSEEIYLNFHLAKESGIFFTIYPKITARLIENIVAKTPKIEEQKIRLLLPLADISTEDLVDFFGSSNTLKLGIKNLDSLYLSVNSDKFLKTKLLKQEGNLYLRVLEFESLASTKLTLVLTEFHLDHENYLPILREKGCFKIKESENCKIYFGAEPIGYGKLSFENDEYILSASER